MLGFSNDFGISVYRTHGMGLRTSFNILNQTGFKCRLLMICHFHVMKTEELKLVLLSEHYSRNLFHIYWLFDSNRTERSCTSGDRGLLYDANSLHRHWRIIPFCLCIVNLGNKCVFIKKTDIRGKVNSQENISVYRILFSYKEYVV